MRKIFCFSLVAIFVFSASGVFAGLNEDAVKENLAQRIEGAIEQEQPGKDINLNASCVEILQVEKADISLNETDIPVYAVKGQVTVPGGGQKSIIKMVVDESGQYQITCQDISSGKSLIQTVKDRINKIDVPEKFGTTVHTGKKGHDVLLVTAPFCPYCKQAFSYFEKHKDNIAEWKIAEFPLDRAGAVATWVVTDCKKNVDPLELIRFAYFDLEPPKERGGEFKNVSQEIIRQFMDEFPEIKEKYTTAEQAHYYLEGKYKEASMANRQAISKVLNVSATPGVFIDGVPVKGWNPERYDSLLGVNKKLAIKE